MLQSKQDSFPCTNFFILVLCYLLFLSSYTYFILIFFFKIQHCLGWEGKGCLIVLLTGKVPGLLTSIYIVDRSGSILKFIIMRQTIKLKGYQSLRGCCQLISSAENQL